MADDLDFLDDLTAELAWRNFGWTRVVNPETGAIGLFPETATDADAWEAKTLAMMADQGRVDLPDKPLNAENTLAERIKILRGD